MVELISHFPPDFTALVIAPSEDGIAAELRAMGVAVEIAPQGAWRKVTGRMTALFRQIPKSARIVKMFAPDLIHANELHSVPAASRAGKDRFPLTGHVRLSITEKQIRTYDMAKCERIVVVSDAVRRLFAESPLLERTRVVYNGVNVAKLKNEGPIPRELAAWRALSPAPLIVGLFGLVSERKNQLIAAEAVTMARAKGADVRLLIAGDSFKDSVAYGEKLRVRLAAEDLRGAAVWLPFQSDVAPLYRAIDVNLLISSEEGFGRTIIEAGAMGKPSIGAETGGIPEIIRCGETGWLVPANDSHSLAMQLIDAAMNRDRIAKLGAAAQKLVNEKFTIQAHVRNMVSVWDEAIEEHARNQR
ncbi:N/A [soil metagenome]